MIDYTDIRLLRELQKNAKLTTKELGDRINLTASPTFERQKRLEREGYITRYVAKVDHRKVGNNLVVFCNIRLKQHSKKLGEEFVAEMNRISEVTECYNTSGDYDYMIKIYLRDMEHYHDFVYNTLGVIDCIGSLHSVFVIAEEKANSGIPIALNTGNTP